SINFGGAGLAYFFYKASLHTKDADLLFQSDVWITHSIKKLATPELLYNDTIGLTKKNVAGSSLFHMPIGIYYVAALIHAATNDIVSFNEAVQNMISSFKHQDTIDLT